MRRGCTFGAQAPDALEQCNGPFSSICTDRDNAPRAHGHRGQLFDAVAQDSRAGRAKGVAERDGTTAGIDPVDRKATHIKVYTGFSAPIDRILCSFEVRDQLRGERFVDLPYGYATVKHGRELSQLLEGGITPGTPSRGTARMASHRGTPRHYQSATEGRATCHDSGDPRCAARRSSLSTRQTI
jgi:hypothetical protein